MPQKWMEKCFSKYCGRCTYKYLILSVLTQGWSHYAWKLQLLLGSEIAFHTTRWTSGQQMGYSLSKGLQSPTSSKLFLYKKEFIVLRVIQGNFLKRRWLSTCSATVMVLQHVRNCSWYLRASLGKLCQQQRQRACLKFKTILLVRSECCSFSKHMYGA